MNGKIDIRLVAAVAAALMLIVGVMWTVPTTPESNSFRFDTARRGFDSAKGIELSAPVEGNIVDGSDVDFYRIGPLESSSQMDVRVITQSEKMIPALRIYDGAYRLIQEKSSEYVRQPGADIETSFVGESNVTYYFEVFTQRNTTGPYTFTIKRRL